MKTSDGRAAKVYAAVGDEWGITYENDGTDGWVSKASVSLLEKVVCSLD